MNFDLLMEEVKRDFEYSIFEVSRIRSPILKDIDKNFDVLRKNNKDINELANLIKNITKFTGIKKVHVVIKPNELDAVIFTRYNKLLPTIFKGKSEETIEVNRIRAEETPKYVDSIYVLFGEKTLDMFRSKELTAILLHEIGHVYQHTSNFSLLMGNITNKVAKWGIVASVLTLLRVIVFPTASMYVAPVIAGLWALSRSLTFFDHMGELSADEYAIKYGYGDELARVFFKFNKMSGGKPRPKNWVQKTWNSVGSFFSLKTHPDDSKRICEMLGKMKRDYKKSYPKFSKEITTIYADIRC